MAARPMSIQVKRNTDGTITVSCGNDTLIIDPHEPPPPPKTRKKFTPITEGSGYAMVTIYPRVTKGGAVATFTKKITMKDGLVSLEPLGDAEGEGFLKKITTARELDLTFDVSAGSAIDFDLIRKSVPNLKAKSQLNLKIGFGKK
jgi:hypothetical protein